MQNEPIVGGIYSIESGDGRFGVVKVLALDPGITHVRIYKNKYESRPHTIDPSTLDLGSILTDEDFGIGHAPLATEGFLSWRPVLIMKTELADDELVGYRFWQESANDRSPAGSER